MASLEAILLDFPLCDVCTARFFVQKRVELPLELLGRMVKNELFLRSALLGGEKGRKLLKSLAKSGHRASSILLERKYGVKSSREKCYICRDLLLESYQDVVAKVLRYVQVLQPEFSTFNVGVKMPRDVVEREDSITGLYQLKPTTPAKGIVVQRLRRKLKELLGKEVDVKHPDVIFVVDIENKSVAVQQRSEYLRSRYRKKGRGFPQAAWICGYCRGKKCVNCNWTGKKYRFSVSELISSLALLRYGSSEFAFHGCGREDIDALSLGAGRSFILELKSPRRREVNLVELAQEINAKSWRLIEVGSMLKVDKSDVRAMKLTAGRRLRTYRVYIKANKPISREEVAGALRKAKNISVHQRTPLRVLHRRPDKVRLKKVFSVSFVRQTSPSIFLLELKTQSGTYIKEFISSDGGRTSPSISEILNSECLCRRLVAVNEG